MSENDIDNIDVDSNIETTETKINEIEKTEVVKNDETPKEISNPEEISDDNLKETSNNKIDEKKTKSTFFIKLFVCFIIIVFLLIFSTIFALININNNNIYSGISIKNIDVSNLSIEEANSKLNEYYIKLLQKEILIIYNDFETIITPEELGMKFDIEQATSIAKPIGKTGSIFKNNYTILSNMIFKKNIELPLITEDEILNNFIQNLSTKLPGLVQESTHYIEGDNLIITKGTNGIKINHDKFKEELIKSIDKLETNTNTTIAIPIIEATPAEIDINKIHLEVFLEPKDAYFTTENNFTLYPHIVGIDFNITIEQAKEIISNADMNEYEIPLKFTLPSVTTNKIGAEAFPHSLSIFTTKYDASNKNRTQNLQLAAEKINGTILLPGETFSFNNVVGKRTIAAGYKDAAMYSNGKVVDGLAGGICQISSTIYDTALMANLEIISRRNHQFLTSYVSAGRDATVVYGSTDFVFKNSRAYPIKILFTTKNGVARCEILGVHEATEYQIEFSTKILQTIAFKTTYIDDYSLSSGQQVVSQNGSNGCISETYIIKKLNGAVVSRDFLSKDSYNAIDKVIKRNPST